MNEKLCIREIVWHVVFLKKLIKADVNIDFDKRIEMQESLNDFLSEIEEIKKHLEEIKK